MHFTGAPQQLSLNLGLRPKRSWSAPKFSQRADLFFALYLDAIAAARSAALARASCGPSQLSGHATDRTLHSTLVPVGVASLLPTQAFSVLERAAAFVDQAAFNVVLTGSRVSKTVTVLRWSCFAARASPR